MGRLLSVRGLSGFRLDAQAREISDSLRRDGLYLPLEAARSMASQERPLLTLEETLACNYCDILRRTLAEPTLRWSMVQLCEALSQGSAQPCVLHSTPVTKRIDQILSDAASRNKAPQSNDPLCVSAWLYNAPVYVKASSSLDDLLGNVLRKVYLIECGYPGLALLPLGSEQINESLKEWGPSSALHPELLDAFEDAYDVTWHNSHYIDFIDACLTEAEQEAYYERRRIDMLTETIRSSTRLNHRQADVLLRALRTSDVVFDYADHQQRYAVSYATARKDIGALVTMGLLYSSVTPEATLRFHPAPSLEHALLRLGKSG